MALAQPQPDLFGAIEPQPRAAGYTPKPEHIRNRFVEFLERMREAERWPWESNRLALYRETVWPYLFRVFPDAEEAARWRAEIEAEAERLDHTA